MPRWKKEDASRLRQLAGEDYSLKEIASGLDRSVEAVRMKMRGLGLNVVDQTSHTPRSTTNERFIDRVKSSNTGEVSRISPFFKKSNAMVVQV